MYSNCKKERKRLSAADIAANKEKYYGAVAQNYTKGGLTYRIFYVDTKIILEMEQIQYI